MNKNCKIIINPPVGFGVVVSIQKIDFRQPSFYCLDYLKIYHSDTFFSPTTLCRFKFDLKENLSYYSKGRMEMIYHVQSKLSDGLNIEEGFSLTFTIVSEDIQDCLKTSMYMCDNGRCIPKNLTCDMKNNCGDNSDETYLLCDSSGHNLIQISDVMYGVVVCLFVFIMFSSWAVIVSRKRRRHHDTDSTSDSDEPTTRITPYQSVHPQGFFICQNPAGPRTPYFQHSKIIHSEGGFTNPCYPTGVPQAPPPYSQ
nr:uncharacterized protein LOC107449523 [Parasteatoda tepidariorum]